jgi:Matrixin
MRLLLRISLTCVFVAGACIYPAILRASESEMTGSKLRGPKGLISIHISSSLSQPASGIPFSNDVLGALQRSLARWEDVADVEFKVLRSENLAVSPKGTIGDGISLITIAPIAENVLLFTNGRSKASALTRVFYDHQEQITEGDIVLNPAFQFSTDGTFGTYDLEAVFTHEIGHLLGLGHSNIGSSIMFDGVPVNSFLEPVYQTSLLSQHDLASIRALYGAGISEPDCCGILQGRFPIASQKPSRNVLVWAQDRSTGAVVNAAEVSKNGSFALNGLTFGTYEVFAQADDPGNSYGALSLGRASVDIGDSKVTDKPGSFVAVPFRIEAVGVENQLSKRAVRLERGRNYRLLVGGRGLDAKGLSFGSSSSLITVNQGSQPIQNFEEGLPAVTLQLTIDNSVPAGEYSLFVEYGGFRRYFVGAVSVN